MLTSISKPLSSNRQIFEFGSMIKISANSPKYYGKVKEIVFAPKSAQIIVSKNS